jgi:hypothetical protein
VGENDLEGSNAPRTALLLPTGGTSLQSMPTVALNPDKVSCSQPTASALEHAHHQSAWLGMTPNTAEVTDINTAVVDLLWRGRQASLSRMVDCAGDSRL